MERKILALMATVAAFAVNPVFAMENDQEVQTITVSKMPSEELFQQEASLREKLKTIRNEFNEQKKIRGSKEFRAAQVLLIDEEKRLREQLDTLRKIQNMLPPSIFSDTEENRFWKTIDGSRGFKELLELENQYNKVVLDLRKTSPGYLPSEMYFTEMDMYRACRDALIAERKELNSYNATTSTSKFLFRKNHMYNMKIEEQKELITVLSISWKDMWTNCSQVYNFSYHSPYFNEQIRGWERGPIAIK